MARWAKSLFLYIFCSSVKTSCLFLYIKQFDSGKFLYLTRLKPHGIIDIYKGTSFLLLSCLLLLVLLMVEKNDGRKEYRTLGTNGPKLRSRASAGTGPTESRDAIGD